MTITKISLVLLLVGLVLGLVIGYGSGVIVYQSKVSEIQSDLSTAQSELSTTQSRVTSLENMFLALSIGLVEVKVGQEFNITLDSNPSTGYQWQLAKQLNGSILVLIGAQYIPSERGRIGAGGTEVWTFKAVKSGTAEISLEYVRPWETDVPPIKEQNFGIIAKD